MVMDSVPATMTGYKGAHVFSPVPGYYEKVMNLDFSSMYPSIVEANNICQSTYVLPEDRGVEVDKEECTIIKAEDTERWYVKEHLRKGRLPEICGELKAERAAARKELATEKNPIRKIVLNARQLALKTSNNGLYGILGLAKAMFPFLEGAESVTAEGRKLILECSTILEKEYGATIIYGDTDSVMFQMPGVTEYVDLIVWGRKLEKEITARMHSKALEFAFEKCGDILIGNKKRYAYWMVDIKEFKDDGSPNPNYGKLKPLTKPTDITYRGFSYAAKGKCLWYKEMMHRTIVNMFRKKSIEESYADLLEWCLSFTRGKEEVKSIINICSVNASYKNPNDKLAVFKREMESIGVDIGVGEKIPYVFFKPDKVGKIYAGERMVPFDLFEERSDTYKVDYGYYLSNVLCNQLEAIWNIYYKDEIERRMAENHRHRMLSVFDDVWYEACNSRNSDAVCDQIEDICDEMDSWADRIDAVKGIYGMKTKVTKIMSRHISGRDVDKSDDMNKPIKTIVKACNNGTLIDLCRKYMDSERLERLLV